MNLIALRDLNDVQVDLDAPLGARTTYRVGGRVRALVTLRDSRQLDEVAEAFATCEMPLLAVGQGSNLLINEGLHDLVAVVLEGSFATLDVRDDGDAVAVRVGAAMALPVVARRLAGEGVVGFEWAVGVPGSFGGAVAMNAGGHGSDVAASLVSVRRWREGSVATLLTRELALGYRTSALRDGDLVLEGELRLARGDADAASARVREIVQWRRAHQPGGANAGSVFRNPAHDAAARLIESVGAKGMRFGSAVVSEKHANFIQADQGGRAHDVFTLMMMVRTKVRDETGITLELENRLVGFEEYA